MAKLPKWPKQPKLSSTAQAWARYEAKVKAVAERRKAIQEKPKHVQAIKARTESLKNKF